MRDPATVGQQTGAQRPGPLLRTTFGAVLRRTRLDQGRTLADVAGKAKVSVPYLSELERGRKEASSEVLAAICAGLRIELSDLLAEAGRSLADDRARRAAVVRLEAIGARRARRASSGARGGDDAQCLLAA